MKCEYCENEATCVVEDGEHVCDDCLEMALENVHDDYLLSDENK